MDDIFVIGYPLGLSSGDGVLPIYKRGSIASEPAVDPMKFLIDARTYSGMSGSPAVCSHSGVWREPGTDFGESIIGTIKKFVGVYSGRRFGEPGPDEASPAVSEIGIVWKRHLIDEIIAGGVRGAPINDFARA